MINAVGNRMTREMARQQKLAKAIETTQLQISSGKKLQNMSDDPVASRRVSTIRTAEASMTAWEMNLNTARSMVDMGEKVMSTTSGLLVRASELALLAANGTQDGVSRSAIASELRAIADELDNLSATRGANGEPIFGAAAHAIRFDSDMAFAPLPTASAAFSIDGISIANILRDSAVAIQAEDGAGMANAITQINGAIHHVAEQHSLVGLSAARMERIDDSLKLRSITVAEERSSLEETDLSEAIARLHAQDLTLNAAQAAFAKINRQTLFDILS